MAGKILIPLLIILACLTSCLTASIPEESEPIGYVAQVSVKEAEESLVPFNVEGKEAPKEGKAEVSEAFNLSGAVMVGPYEVTYHLLRESGHVTYPRTLQADDVKAFIDFLARTEPDAVDGIKAICRDIPEIMLRYSPDRDWDGVLDAVRRCYPKFIQMLQEKAEDERVEAAKQQASEANAKAIDEPRKHSDHQVSGSFYGNNPEFDEVKATQEQANAPKEERSHGILPSLIIFCVMVFVIKMMWRFLKEGRFLWFL